MSRFRDHGGAKCKHIYAVEHLLGRDRDDGVAVHGTPRPGPKPPPRRPTYPRDWPLYNETQTNEEDEFEPLLHALCQSIRQPKHLMGRRPVPLPDIVFACVAKVYLDRSARLVIPRLNRACKEGYLTRPIKFGRMTAFLESESATPILHDLIIRSSLPVVPIERVFAVDSTGFVGSRFVRWQDLKYRGSDERDWAKMHAMCGVETLIFTAVVIKERDAADLHQLEELLRITAQNFTIARSFATASTTSSRTRRQSRRLGRGALFRSSRLTRAVVAASGRRSSSSGMRTSTSRSTITTNAL